MKTFLWYQSQATLAYALQIYYYILNASGIIEADFSGRLPPLCFEFAYTLHRLGTHYPVQLLMLPYYRYIRYVFCVQLIENRGLQIDFANHPIQYFRVYYYTQTTM